ncbi:hypothetical protein JCM16106_17140 [Hydrogenophilus islandicus]
MRHRIDFDALSWIADETAQALGRARALVAEALQSFDPASLREAQTHLFAAKSVLEVAEIAPLPRVLSLIERAIDQLLDAPEPSTSALATLEEALIACENLWYELTHHHHWQPLRLQSVYLAVAQLVRDPSAHPADLFLLPLPTPSGVAQPLAPAERDAAEARLRHRFTASFAQWLKRQEAAALLPAREALVGRLLLDAGTPEEPLWIAATAYLEAVIRKQLPWNEEARSTLQAIQRAQKGARNPEAVLALFRRLTLALAPLPPKTRLQRLIHQYWRLRDWLDGADRPIARSPLAELDQRVAEAAAAARTLWEGQTAWSERSNALLAVVRALLARSDPDAHALAATLEQFAHRLPELLTTHPSLDLLLATTLLALEEGAKTGTLTAAGCQSLVAQWQQALAGEETTVHLQPANDAASSTLAVRAEVKQLCDEIEHAIDQFWRHPDAALPLGDLKKWLDQLAAIAIVTNHDPLVGEIETVRGWLQRVADGEERFDPHHPLVAQIATWAQRLSEPAEARATTERSAPQPIPWAALFPERHRQEPSGEATTRSRETGPSRPAETERAEPETQAAPQTPPPPQPEGAAASSSAAPAAAASDETAELRAIFLAECDEILEMMRTAFVRLCNDPRDRDALTLWRRQAHTLKGSSRIVGLTHFGETAWEVEQTLNHWLRDPDFLPSPEVLAFLEATEVAFRDAAAAVAATGSDLPAPIAEIVARARSLRGEAVAPPPAAPTPSEAVPPPWGDVDFEPPQLPPSPATTPTADSDRTFRFGDRAVSRSLFEIFRVEAREHLATLARFLQNPETPSDAVVRAAHTLASICGTTQIPEMHDLARAWEFALRAMQQAGLAPNDQQLTLFQAIHAALYSDLATVENGAIPPLRSDLITALTSATPLQQTPAAVAEEGISEPREIAKGEEKPKPKRRRKTKAEPQAEAVPPAEKGPEAPGATPSEAASETIDTALLPIFAEEGRDLFTQLDAALERLPATGVASESDLEPILRLLHTLKGSARMAGALRLGDEIHQIEQHLKEAGAAAIAALPQLLAAARAHFLQLITRPLAPQGEEGAAPEERVTEERVAEETGEAVSAPLLAMSLRVPAPLIDRWVNDLSEIGIQRARAEGELVALRHATLELTENVQRLRQQLRELEIQAESQLQARIQIAETAQTPFDPLELDRYTRLQELTRLLAEGVADVATLQQSILRAADAAEVSLHRQARQTRDLQSEITELRAVPVATIRERLARIVAQTAETLGKRAQLTLVGGETRVDRAALERLLPALEHLVRNAVAHGIEPPEVRQERGKPAIGSITLTVTAPSGETRWTLTDDGAGLDFDAILAKAREKGWVAPDATPSEAELARLIFRSGFSTAREVSPIAGRGVGMDVVQAEVTALGGRIEIASERGAGTRITLFVPTELTLVQLLLVVGNNRRWGIPTETIVHTQQYKAEVLAELLTQGAVEHLGARYPLVGLHTLIAAPEPPREGRQWVVFVQSGDERLALWVEGITGRQEFTAKPTGPFLRRIAGMLGAVLLPDGEIALVLQPTALLQTARAAAVTHVATAATEDAAPREAHTPSPPLIFVVDDSLTVRRLTQRLLERAGYRVALAKDGQEALETLETVSPDAILSDIEMPRMDGFELLRHLRARPQTRATPVIMITSRLADKHRTHAFELGANEYLGKPYQEEVLLALLSRYAPLNAPERVG